MDHTHQSVRVAESYLFALLLYPLNELIEAFSEGNIVCDESVCPPLICDMGKVFGLATDDHVFVLRDIQLVKEALVGAEPGRVEGRHVCSSEDANERSRMIHVVTNLLQLEHMLTVIACDDHLVMCRHYCLIEPKKTRIGCLSSKIPADACNNHPWVVWNNPRHRKSSTT